MENQTRFDLNSAIHDWQQELAAQAGLTPEVRPELETHLRDCVTELAERGLNAEESFWLARRRVGQPQALGEEFAKANPATVWRQRLFWMILGVFAAQLWFGFAPFLWDLATRPVVRHLSKSGGQVLPDWVLFYLPFPSAGDFQRLIHSPLAHGLFSLLPIICLAVLLARGLMDRVASTLQFAFQSRRRFVGVSVALFFIYCSWMVHVLLNFAQQQPSQGNPSVGFVIRMILSRLLFGVAMVAMIAWLIPGRNRPATQEPR